MDPYWEAAQSKREGPALRSNRPESPIPAMPLNSSVTFGQVISHLDPRFPHLLQRANEDSPVILRLLDGMLYSLA